LSEFCHLGIDVLHTGQQRLLGIGHARRHDGMWRPTKPEGVLRFELHGGAAVELGYAPIRWEAHDLQRL
jgi:hypothetical protein